jgi:hypothetical protein
MKEKYRYQAIFKIFSLGEKIKDYKNYFSHVLGMATY